MSAVMGSGPREKLGISDYAGGPDPVHGLDAPHPDWDVYVFGERIAPPRVPTKAAAPDWDQEQEHHRRRLMLMRMQGEVNRQERRVYIWWTVAAVFGALALIGSML